MKQNQITKQWPDELDALIASTQHHKLLFENEFVRVLDTNISTAQREKLPKNNFGGTTPSQNCGAFL